MPGIIGTIVSRNLATLHELDTVYGTQDMHDMLEIVAVDSYNQRVMQKQAT